MDNQRSDVTYTQNQGDYNKKRILQKEYIYYSALRNYIFFMGKKLGNYQISHTFHIFPVAVDDLVIPNVAAIIP